MTIIRSLGGSILNPRSVFAPEKEGRDKIPPGDPSGENGVQGESQGTWNKFLVKAYIQTSH